MKRFVFVLVCMVATAWGQPATQPQTIPTVDIPMVGSRGAAALADHRSGRSYGHALGFFNATSFGVSGRGYFSLGKRQQSTPELSVGLFHMNSAYVPSTYIGGYIYSQGLFILPIYLGVRYNIVEERAGRIDWSWFLRGGGGPTVGMLTPLGLGFFDTFKRMQFHWGLGAYAASGVEFTFDETYTFFLQGGVDYLGFFNRVGDRNSLVGPSLSIGFGKLIP